MLREYVYMKFQSFYWLIQCEITNATIGIIVDRWEMLIKDFNDRFDGLKKINFLSWLTQPLLIDIFGVLKQFQVNLSELQHEFFVQNERYQNEGMWWSRKECDWVSYLVECGHSADDDDLLWAKKSRLEITKCSDLQLKQTKFSPWIKEIFYSHLKQCSH